MSKPPKPPRPKLPKPRRERGRPVPASLRRRVYERDNYTCQICRRGPLPESKLTLDHIIPLKYGGPTVEDNLRTVCRDCFQKIPPADWWEFPPA